MKKFSKMTWKKHYVDVCICKETDLIYRKCYTCLECKPLDREHFNVDSHDKQGFMAQCKDCRNNYKRERKEIVEKEKQAKTQQKAPKEFKEKSLFEESDSTETKLNKILAYLWLK